MKGSPPSRPTACYHHAMSDGWKVCSVCRKAIGFGQVYYVCNVSTCNRKRTALYFCSVACCDAHLPEARHRDAWAEVKTAPAS